MGKTPTRSVSVAAYAFRADVLSHAVDGAETPVTHLPRFALRLAPLLAALALGLAPSDLDPGAMYAQTDETAQTAAVTGVAPVPAAGVLTLVTAGTADLQTLIDAQQFAVESVWLYDAGARRFLAFVVGGPAFANTLTAIRPTDVVTLRPAPLSPTNPAADATEVSVGRVDELAPSSVAATGRGEGEAAVTAHGPGDAPAWR